MRASCTNRTPNPNRNHKPSPNPNPSHGRPYNASEWPECGPALSRMRAEVVGCRQLTLTLAQTLTLTLTLTLTPTLTLTLTLTPTLTRSSAASRVSRPQQVYSRSSCGAL